MTRRRALWAAVGTGLGLLWLAAVIAVFGAAGYLPTQALFTASLVTVVALGALTGALMCPPPDDLDLETVLRCGQPADLRVIADRHRNAHPKESTR